MSTAWVKVLGMWILCDGWYSIVAWMGQPNQSWWKDHSMRIVRILVGGALIIWG